MVYQRTEMSVSPKHSYWRMKKRLRHPLSKKNGKMLQSSIFEILGQERVKVTFLPKTVNLHGLTYCSPFSTYCYTVAGHSQASSRCYTHSDTPTLPCHRQLLRCTYDHSYRYDFHMELLLWKTNLLYDKTQIWCRWISIKKKKRHVNNPCWVLHN